MAVVAALALVAVAYGASARSSPNLRAAETETIDFPVRAQASLALRQPDGKLVAVGTVDSSAFGLVRYAPDGAIDRSFGAEGRVLTPLGPDVSVRDATVQGDGTILVTGTASGGDAAARYNPDGSLDPTFGGDGVARGALATVAGGAGAAAGTEPPLRPSSIAEDFSARFQPEHLRPLALSALPGERILVAGSAFVAGTPELALGEGDTGGVDPLGARLEPTTLQAAAVQDDGKVLVAGPAAPTAPGELALSRYNADGSPDESFGAGGAVALPLAELGGEPVGVAVAPGGRIILAAASASTVAVLAPGGEFERSFGSNGLLRAPLGGRSTIEGVTAAADQLVVYGVRDGRVALARFGLDGSPDRSFGDDGVMVSSLPAFDHGTERAAIEPDGTIVVAGSRDGRFALAWLGADGSPDRRFGDRGEAVSDVAGTATAVAAEPGGGVIVAGSPADGQGSDIVLARFDGSPGEAPAGEASVGEAAGRAQPDARAAADPRRPRHAHPLGPPHPVPAWYINASSFQELKQFAAQDVCNFARTQPRSAQRTLVLDFGGGRAYGHGSFGAAVNNATFEATNGQILQALRTAADAYAACHRRGRAVIAYANTNHFSLPAIAARARKIGVHQAKTVARFGAYVHRAGYAAAEHAGLAGDIEPGYWGPSQSKAMVNGAKSVRHHDYMDFGTAGGCPPYLKGQHRSKHHKCLNDWTLDDVAHVSNSGGGEPLPEIYYRGGRLHYDQAAQWALVARRWNSRHATPYAFFGATGSTEFSSLTPSDSWKRLKHRTVGHVGRELLNFRQDHGPTLTAAHDSDAIAR